MKIYLFLFFLLSAQLSVQSQVDSTTTDTLMKGELADVIVTAFEQNRRLIEVPAAVSYLSATSLGRFGNTNILSAVNTVAGVRMEERSPGSYRLNIRGSSMRSPFGVRNVKVYYNNIPFTDPGGQTYLNQLGFYNFRSIEIIKGPGSSLYGSGTGGVILINNRSNTFEQGYSVDYSTGSYNLQNINAEIKLGSDSFQNTVSFQRQTSSGYREQSALERNVFTWNSTIKRTNKSSLSADFLYGDLYYQTPGPLNINEYNTTPEKARPRAGALPGSVENRAAIFQKMILAGATYVQFLNSNWQNTSTLYGAFTQIENPSIRNYEKRNEPHAGGRTTFQFKKATQNSELLLHFGGELQQSFNSIQVFKNKQGVTDTLLTNDEVKNRQAFLFTQLTFAYKNWIFIAGASLNLLKYNFATLATYPNYSTSRRFNNEVAPRFAILKKLTNNISIYNSIAKGFSPPTSAEVLPSNSIINTSLNAEQGINYEIGFKGNAFKGIFNFDINTFLFNLNNTIVQRRDATSADYFINAGSTKQKGVESSFSLEPLRYQSNHFVRSRFWASYTYNNFKYRNFQQGIIDYSGKALPGVAPHTFASGVDFISDFGAYINLNYLYSDPIALNDANSDFATSYNLLGCRFGYKSKEDKNLIYEIFAGGDNLLNQKYSLGNDINGFNGRYYNAAPLRNYYVGISIQFIYKK